MVLEAILNPLQAEKKPWEMFFIGILYSSIAITLSMIIFGKDASLVAVFLTVLATIPIMYGAIKLEENKDMTIKDEKKLLKEHGKALTFFMYLFMGISVSFALWFVFLEPPLVDYVFSVQTRTIYEINSGPTGNYINSMGIFSVIFLNNIKVLIFCLLFAFLYGFGAIFILVWNASVLGTAIGSLVKNSITSQTIIGSKPGIIGTASVFLGGLLKYSVHGIPEILAYFIAGLAGGIISIAVIKHDFRSRKFKHVLIDSLDLIGLSVIVLFIAALIEVFITPALF